MRIPLDYYRILGLPLAASHEQLQQAYSDRTVQLPRREYSDAAIIARKQIIEEAYTVLSDSKQRTAYDESYLAQTYNDPSVGTRMGTNRSQIEPQTSSIEISPNEFVGALLILQELGEYELVLKLGRPYFTNTTTNTPTELRSSVEESATERADIVLTVTFACLELGREQWQQGQYENAATSLETGQELLKSEGLFESVRLEIQADISKLRPYRILELLALPEENFAQRRQGLQLLQTILQERGGIDGALNDGSGLNIDDFLRFIQQLRGYLTAAEQQKLFDAESKRPSAVATYLAVYALLGRGFAERQPALIRQGKQMLMRLSKRQDVHLEQAVCALLLGQTEEASRALELSHEYEPLAFIRENSQDSPDLLPGLCLYGERWLHKEVFPHFRDLANQQTSLKDYFADEQVQAYLEALPTDAEVTPDSSSKQTNIRNGHGSNSPTSTIPINIRRENTHRPPPAKSESRHESVSAAQTANTATLNTTQEPDVAFNEHNGGQHHHSNGSRHAVVSEPTPPPQPRRQRRSQNGSSGHSQNTVNHRLTNLADRFRQSWQSPKRFVWLILFGVFGVIGISLLMTIAAGLLKDTLSGEPELQSKQLTIALDQPPIPIPSQSKAVTSDGLLTKTSADELISTWLSTKAAAFSTSHNISGLEQILTASALSQWQGVAQQDKADDSYRLYQHKSLKIESVKTNEAEPNKAEVEASVNEVAKFYDRGKLNSQKSYNENLKVKYYLVRTDGKWHIREMVVLNKTILNS